MKEMGRQIRSGARYKKPRAPVKAYMKKGYHPILIDMLGEAGPHGFTMPSVTTKCLLWTGLTASPSIAVVTLRRIRRAFRQALCMLARYAVYGNKERVNEGACCPSYLRLVKKAAAANMGFNIDGKSRTGWNSQWTFIEAC